MARPDRYSTLFAALPQETMPADLPVRIRAGITAARLRAARQRARSAIVLSGVSALSLGGFAYALTTLASAARLSGFTSYASLAFSDQNIVAANLSSFVFTLLESLPGFETMLALALLSVFLVSLASAVGMTDGRTSSGRPLIALS